MRKDSRKRKKRALRCAAVRRIVAGLAALCGLLSVPTGAETLPVAAEVSSRAAVLYEPESGRVLYEKQAHTPLPMASTTKLMTALLAAESLSWEQMVTATEQAVRVEGSSLGLRAGDTLTVRDLVTGMLLASGNDAANTVALSVCDSTEAFAERMNRRAAELGMRDSHFVTPSGLDGDGHAASAYDMALLAAAVLRQPVLREICALQQAQIRISGVTVTVGNHNRLLKLYPDAVGLKTGYTTRAGKCLVSAARRDGVLLIAVTLNGGDYWNDHIRLYEAGFACTEAVTLPLPPLPGWPVAGGRVPEVPLTAEPATAVLLRGEAAQVTARVRLAPFAWAPVAEGQAAGEIEYTLSGRVIAAVPLYAAAAAAERPELSYRERLGRMLGALLRSLAAW